MDRRATGSLLVAVLWSGAFALASCGRGDRGADPAGGAPADPSGAPSTGTRADGPPDEARLARDRDRMVDELAAAEDAPIVDARLLEALRRVPRHEFVPPELRGQGYDNTALPIPESQTISQPYIVALMTQLLALRGTEKVLEVGTGSGYQAAILGELAREVYTVEIRPALLETAKKKLRELKDRGVLRYQKLEAFVGDGSLGHPEAAPYDAIIVTAAPTKIPVELLNQLKPGGRMVIPVGGEYIQELQLILKREDGSWVQQSIVPVRFRRLDEEGGAG